MSSSIVRFPGSGRGRAVAALTSALFAALATAVPFRSASGRELPPIDALAGARPASADQQAALGAGPLTEFRGHVDARIGVPTFVWASGRVAPVPVSAVGNSAEGVARAHLMRLAPA